jgi:serine/threonine-protein kinase RsbT
MTTTLSAASGLTMTVKGEADLLQVRSALRAYAQQAGLGLTSATKLVTAGSELARNIVRYATHGQGVVEIELVSAKSRRGVRAVFRDEGPGIADLDAALRDGWSTGGSLGLGLPGSRRLVDEFDIQTAAGTGTTVTIAQWSR